MINTHQILHFIKHFFTARRKGHGIHSPFAYQLCEEVFYNPDSFYDFEILNEVRSSLWSNDTKIEVQDFGAGSKTFGSNARRISAIAKYGISSNIQSELLYKLINYMGCKTSFELGTSLGLNTLYMAKACSQGQVYSFEGSPALVTIASGLAKQLQASNIHFVSGRFDDTLPQTLAAINKIDLLYVDGNHTYEATLRYFEMALPYVHEQSVMIFDDIYWSPGMTAAWKKITEHPEVTLSLDGFYFGLVFFKKEIKEKTCLKIYL